MTHPTYRNRMSRRMREQQDYIPQQQATKSSTMWLTPVIIVAIVVGFYFFNEYKKDSEVQLQSIQTQLREAEHKSLYNAQAAQYNTTHKEQMVYEK